MRQLGIVRRIDDLGRICIPKEVRRTLEIKENDALEMFINNNSLILKRWIPETEDKKETALESALDFLESLPAPPVDIIQLINEALEVE